MKYHVVTTMNAEAWQSYGRRMAESFVKRWPSSASLTVYAEGFAPDIDGVHVMDLPDWVEEFRGKHGGKPQYDGNVGGRYDFRFDMRKFAFKSGALTDFGLCVTDGVMIWLDADMFFHSAVSEEFLERLFPQPAYLAWLERMGGFPETGFVMFRADHAAHRDFMMRLRDLYVTDEILNQKELHDAFLIWEIGKSMMAKREIPRVHNLSGAGWRTNHPAANSMIASIADHFKGERKRNGISNRRDLILPRPEPYWKNAR